MIDLFKVYGSALPHTLLLETLASGYVGEGPRTEELASAFTSLVESQRPVLMMNSCTEALEMALHLCDVSGYEVITTPMTCTATTAAIIREGGHPVWADIDPLTGLIDPADVERKITINTRAIVAVDWGGRACDYDALRDNWRNGGYAADRIPVIEDAAHAMLTRYRDSSIAVSGGDYVCWSFGPIKHFSCGGHGGALLTPDHETSERARLLRWYGLDRNSRADFRCEQDVIEAGWKAHMTDVDAAIGLENIPAVPGIVAEHRDHAKLLRSLLVGAEGVAIPEYDPDSAYWIFDVLLDTPSERASLETWLKERGIASSRVHRRNDEHPAYNFPNGYLSGVTQFDSRHLCLPVGWWLDDEDITTVANAVRAWAYAHVEVLA